MRRAAAARLGEKILLWLYWACSGYALRANRALACLAVTIAATIMALTVWGSPATGTDLTGHGTLIGPAGPEPITLTIRRANPVKPTSARAEKATEITLNAVIFRGADTQITTVGRYLDLLARILGPLFLGLSPWLSATRSNADLQPDVIATWDRPAILQCPPCVTSRSRSAQCPEFEPGAHLALEQLERCLGQRPAGERDQPRLGERLMAERRDQFRLGSILRISCIRRVEF